jgi:hypothetical protein
LRNQYKVFGVADGDIPADVILDRLINLPIGSHARAVAVINTIMLPSMIGIRGNEPSDVSDMSSQSAVSRPRGNHPGHPPANVRDGTNVAHSFDHFLHDTPLNATDSAAGMALEEVGVVDSRVDSFSFPEFVPEHAAELDPANNLAGMQPGPVRAAELDPANVAEMQPEEGAVLERDSNESEGSEPQKKKSRTT